MRKVKRRGIVTIAFDDAYLATYKHAIKHLDKRGLKCTVAVPASYIGKRFEKRRVCGVRELKRLVKNGHEIASHTSSHPNLLRLSEKDKKRAFAELYVSKKQIKKALKVTPSSFVFPYIKKNRSRALYIKVKKFYKSARVTSYKPYFDSIPITDPYDIVGFAVTKRHKASYLNKLVDYAHKKNYWLVEVFHLVSDKNTLSASRPRPYRFFTHIKNFKKHVDHIISRNVLVLPQRDVVRRFYRGTRKF